ncbi:MAG: efflux RND transporter periplasmic adaptor subunit, partial [Phycisphaerae bacterium]
DVSEAIALRYLGQGRNGEVDKNDEDRPEIAVALADEKDFPHPGMVDFVDNNLDATTGTLKVRAELPNPTKKLYPGLFARVRIPWAVRENAVLIYEEAVGTGLEGKFVMTIDEKNLAQRTPIKLGDRQDDGTILVLEGLSSDQTYIVRGIQKARPGAPVNAKSFTPDMPKPETTETNPQSAEGNLNATGEGE